MKATADRDGPLVVRLALEAETEYDRRTLALLALEFLPAPSHGDDVLRIGGFEGPSKRLRVLRCLEVHGRPMKPAAISAATGIARNYVTVCLGRLLAAGQVSMPTSGEYRYVQPVTTAEPVEPISNPAEQGSHEPQ